MGHTHQIAVAFYYQSVFRVSAKTLCYPQSVWSNCGAPSFRWSLLCSVLAKSALPLANATLLLLPAVCVVFHFLLCCASLWSLPCCKAPVLLQKCASGTKDQLPRRVAKAIHLFANLEMLHSCRNQSASSNLKSSMGI